MSLLIRNQIEQLKAEVGYCPDRGITSKYYTTLLLICRLAYYPEEGMVDLVRDLNARKSIWYSSESTQAVYAEFEKFDVLTFRGTYFSDRDELRTLSTFAQASYLTYKVHTGFAEALASVSEGILIDLKKRDPERRLIFTGHSMGGALASLLAAQLRPHELTTFGAPRVFDKETPSDLFADIITRRVVNKYDIVAHLPFECLGYKHIGDEVKIPNSFSINPITNHKLGTYLKALIDKDVDIW